MTGIVADIAAAHRIMVKRSDRRPAVLRCAPDVEHTLRLEIWQLVLDPNARIVMTGPTEPGPIGLRLDHDKYLPAGVWRLCDAHDTLLYDSREGKPLP